MSHLVELYAQSTSSKISKPYILEKYYPLEFDNYIVFHSTSKPAKTYGYFNDVIKILTPSLGNTKLIQIGGKDDVRLEGCFDLCGKTNIGQTAYIIKRAKLICGVDSFPLHIASAVDTPIVGLYAGNFANNVKPYFGSPEKQVILEADRKGLHPNFALDENPRTINNIKPEIIAQSICKLLNLPFNYPYKTLLINPFYNNKIVETIPNQIVNTAAIGIDSVIVRMDVLFSEHVLTQQIQHSKVTIVTIQPLSPSFLKNFKPQIKEIHYEITENFCLPFIKNVIESGIRLVMFSYLPSEKLNKIKLKTMDYGIIWRKEIRSRTDYPELKDVLPEKLYYKTNKFTLSNKQIYPSLSALANNQPIPNFQPAELPLINNELFF